MIQLNFKQAIKLAMIGVILEFISRLIPSIVYDMYPDNMIFKICNLMGIIGLAITFPFFYLLYKNQN